MSQQIKFPYYFRFSPTVPHIAEVDLKGDQVAIVVAVVCIDQRNGDLYYIRLDHLDEIDSRRLSQIIRSRDSHRYALWDLLSQKTLPNGMNALDFFQQMVRVRTIGGVDMVPGTGKRGIASLGFGDTRYTGPESYGFTAPADRRSAPVTAPTVEADVEFDYAEIEEGDGEQIEVAPKRKAGRPKKAAAK